MSRRGRRVRERAPPSMGADSGTEDDRDAFARASGMPPAYFAAAAARYPAAQMSALRVFLALRTVARRVDNTVTHWLDGSGLTSTKFDVLHLLYAADPEGATNAELRDHLMMTQPNVTFVMKGLEASGYAERRLSPTDRRSSIFTITDGGRELIDRLTPAHLDAISTALVPIAVSHREALIAALATIAEGFESASAPATSAAPEAGPLS